jgi:hypothetical protein
MATTQNDELTKLFEDADAGREYIESVRWADGVTCPHCSVKEAYKRVLKALFVRVFTNAKPVGSSLL